MSVASGWEIAIKESVGRLQPPGDLKAVMVHGGLIELAITWDHTNVIKDLPHHHGDPFDRMLIAQAQVENCSLVTRDSKMSQYDVRVIHA